MSAAAAIPNTIREISVPLGRGFMRKVGVKAPGAPLAIMAGSDSSSRGIIDCEKASVLRGEGVHDCGGQVFQQPGRALMSAKERM